MPTFREPDDVDFIVDSGPCSPEMDHATGEYIKAYKLRASARNEEEIAQSEALLEQWGRVIEDLDRVEQDDDGRPTIPTGSAETGQ